MQMFVDGPMFRCTCVLYLGNTCVISADLCVNHAWLRYDNMAKQGRFTYDSNEEDWDIPALEYINSQLEYYLRMVGTC